MKVLLLGATGFAGKNIAGKLKQNPGLTLVESSRSLGCDLRLIENAKTLIKKTQPDFIINCAAHVGSLNYVTQQAANVIQDNGRMNLNLYEAVTSECKTAVVINPIANCAYPSGSNTFIEEEWLNGDLHPSVLSYGSTKRFLWHIAESYAMQHHIKSIHLFVPNMYGPYDSTDPNKAHALDALISKFVKAEQEGKKEIDIWGTGIAVREWLYAPDFAEILERIMIIKMTDLDKPVNIGQNFGLSVKELVGLINKKFDDTFTIKWDPSMPDGTPKKVMDDTRFKKVFGIFQFTKLDAGIDATVSYYKSIYPY